MVKASLNTIAKVTARQPPLLTLASGKRARSAALANKSTWTLASITATGRMISKTPYYRYYASNFAVGSFGNFASTMTRHSLKVGYFFTVSQRHSKK